MEPVVTIVGGGFAGAEAAWAAAQRGVHVRLYEMRPGTPTAVHRTGNLAEPVCSNSLKSNRIENASGLLKEEMRGLGSLILPCAEAHRVPAGEALAVDAEAFSREVTERIDAHPLIEVIREEVTSLPPERPLILATGPLTSEPMALALRDLVGGDCLAFYDAVAPTVTLESLDMSLVFRASRRGKGFDSDEPDEEGPPADYLNCPLDRDQYLALQQALAEAEPAEPHLPDEERTPYFDACMPVEELARRGPRTLAFGPMRPIGLRDPRTGRRPYAAVQLRQENRAGTLWGLVGFQTRLKWPEQQRIVRLIPGLQNAEIVRYGVMHRNTYVCSPHVLLPTFELLGKPDIYLAGQITGVEGYVESAASGILAGLNAARALSRLPGVVPPDVTVLGSLVRYLVETPAKRFSPMNANYGILPPLPERIRARLEKARRYADRARPAYEEFLRGL